MTPPHRTDTQSIQLTKRKTQPIQNIAVHIQAQASITESLVSEMADRTSAGVSLSHADRDIASTHFPFAFEGVELSSEIRF